MDPPRLRKSFTPSTVLATAGLLVVFVSCLAYMDLAADAAEQVEQFYPWFINVQVCHV